MDPRIYEIKSRRAQQLRLQRELEQLESEFQELVRAEVVAELKSQAPELQTVEATEAIGGWSNVVVYYKVTFTNGVVCKAPGNRSAVGFTLDNGESFVLEEHAMAKPDYVFKHRIKAIRIAVNEAVVVWKRLEPLLQRVAPSAIKRQCSELLKD